MLIYCKSRASFPKYLAVSENRASRELRGTSRVISNSWSFPVDLPSGAVWCAKRARAAAPKRGGRAAFGPSLLSVAGGFPRRDALPGRNTQLPLGERGSLRVFSCSAHSGVCMDGCFSESSRLVALHPAGDRRRVRRVSWTGTDTGRLVRHAFVFGLRSLFSNCLRWTLECCWPLNWLGPAPLSYFYLRERVLHL